jgi:glycosyltransferase involved in cell wall biosynthesis
MNENRWVALLGRQDTPTDGVDDYCTFLSQALAPRGVELRKSCVRWFELGRVRALLHLWRECAEWRGTWVLVEYTALSWSRRGFPFYALAIVAILQRCGARCAIVFHEPQGVSVSKKWIGRIRRASQNWVARGLHSLASKSIFADPLETIPWLPRNDPRAAFIPIGANIPEPRPKLDNSAQPNGTHRTIAIFCLSDEPNVLLELHDIAVAARKAAKNGARMRILFVGRGTANAEAEIARVFRDVPVEISNLGIVSAENVSDTLAECDAMLCVRGKIYPNRGSAIAGIACGMPIVGYAGGAEGTPLAEAGLVLVPYRDAEALGDALLRVLSDPVLSRELRDKSLRAQRTYFSWDLIAGAFIKFLRVSGSDT